MTTCPYCRTSTDTHVSLDTDAGPGEGDTSICASCYRPAIFGPGAVSLRKPTPRELAELATDPEVRAAVDVIRGLGQ